MQSLEQLRGEDFSVVAFIAIALVHDTRLFNEC